MSTRARTWKLGAPALVTLGACASSSAVPPARFINGPVVGVVDDRRDVPHAPAVRTFLPSLEFYNVMLERPITRALEVRRTRRALGVNALDEVPDSTWFTNRIGRRALSPDEVFAGPVTMDSPELHTPWTIRQTKPGGREIGFVVTDVRGVKYLLKFDGENFPELETGTHVAVNRLLWAAGYHVPEDLVVYFRPADLIVTATSEVKDVYGNRLRTLERAELERDLARVHHEPDGRIRALASRWLSGTSIGGHVPEGVRADDPNDRIPHELRRDLRGAFPVFAWLDHVDVTWANLVDMWIADPADPNRHYVEHYAIDFGKALGASELTNHNRRDGTVYTVDFPDILRSLLTLGIAPRPYDGRGSGPSPRGVSSMFEARTFDPAAWHPLVPYSPFVAADRFDGFWGAKLVARFTRAQIRAAVMAGRFTDPRAVDALTDTLVARQHATAAFWFARVNPLDRFTIASGGGLCFDDLAIRAGLAAAAGTRYAIVRYDWGGHQIGGGATFDARPEGREGRSCTSALALSTTDGGYTIVKLTTLRRGFGGSTFVHLARTPDTGTPRVIGVWRP